VDRVIGKNRVIGANTQEHGEKSRGHGEILEREDILQALRYAAGWAEEREVVLAPK